ncbi:MAG: OmpA family protein [Bacteroidales bacterium]|nr:OmpA family protein [Bacteroidales bacterium]
MKTKILCALLCIAGSLYAQDSTQVAAPANSSSSRHEVSIYGGGGFSSLHYRSFGGQKDGFGGQGGLGYTWFFREAWGVNINVGVSSYRSKMRLNDFRDHYPAVDIDGNDFDFRTTINQTEKHHALFFDIPLMFQYVQPKQSGWWFAVGGKASIPLSAKTKGNASFVTSGYYEYEDYEYFDPLMAGFGQFSGAVNPSVSLKTSWTAILEGGWHFRLEEYWRLYVGFYFDFGLNNIQKTEDRHIVAFDAAHPTEYAPVGSVLTSRYTRADGYTAPYMDKLSQLAGGIKVRLTFLPSSNKKNKLVLPPILPPFPPDKQVKKPDTIPPSTPPVPELPYEPIPADLELTPEPDITETPGDIKDLMSYLSGEAFEFNSFELTPAAQEAMDYVADWLTNQPNVRIELEGHTDNKGTPAYNQKLSERRAKVMCDYLITKGIASERLSYKGYGLTKPIATNDTEEGRQKNRRMGIKIVH